VRNANIPVNALLKRVRVVRAVRFPNWDGVGQT